MSKYSRILSALGTVVLLSMLVPSGALAQEAGSSKDIEGLFENVFGGGEQPLEASEVPRSIRHAAMAAVGGDAEQTASGVEIAPNGTLLYVLDFRSREGRSVSVDVTSSGRVVSVEHALKMEELPGRVSDTLRRWAPNLEAQLIEKSVRPDGVVYEFVGTSQGREFYAEIPSHAGYFFIRFHDLWFPPIPIPIPIPVPIGW